LQFRLGVNKPSSLVVERDYDKLLVEDVHLKKNQGEAEGAGVSSVEIGGPATAAAHLPRPASIIISRKSAEISSRASCRSA
jgi:small subunit ribosomal protein S3